jgi:NTE family protein
VDRSDDEQAPPRIGLVLGGGGMPGIAFHAGTLLALHHDLGFDPRSADVIVGTSAGSIVGAMLRAGLSPDDLTAWSSRTSPGPGREHLRVAIDRVGEVGLRLARPRPMRSASRSAAGMAIASLNFGPLDGTRALREVDDLLGDWPEQTLLIAAVRSRDAQRVLFGGDVTPRVRDAVAASCAIPGVFRPVHVDGTAYVDGGVHSPTNADVLVDPEHGPQVDVAIVLSAMTGGTPPPRWRLDRSLRPLAVLRSLAKRRLDAEVARLRSAGIATIVFEPDAATARAAGWNALDHRRIAGVARGAFLGALDDRHRHDPSGALAMVTRKVPPAGAPAPQLRPL